MRLCLNLIVVPVEVEEVEEDEEVEEEGGCFYLQAGKQRVGDLTL